MILQAQAKILMKQILQRILMIHFLFARAMATNQCTECEMDSLVYSDGSETSEEDEKDSSRLENLQKPQMSTRLMLKLCNNAPLYSNLNAVKKPKLYLTKS